MIPVAGAQMGSEGDDDELRVGKGEGELTSPVGRGASELNMLEMCETMHVEALVMRRLALPKDHPIIATSLGNLANLYREQRRYEARCSRAPTFSFSAMSAASPAPHRRDHHCLHCCGLNAFD